MVINSHTSTTQTTIENPFEEKDFINRLLFKCHTIIRNSDGLTPIAAFEELCKVLVLKMYIEEKNNHSNGQNGFLQIEHLSNGIDETVLNQIFGDAIRTLDLMHIFSPNDTIRAKKGSFQIVWHELEKLNLSKLSDTQRGDIFDDLIMNIARGRNSEFITPRPIVNYMVQMLDPEENEHICDPCCGSGGFLVTSHKHIKSKVEKRIDSHNIEERFRALNRKSIVGIDLNYTTAKIAKLNLWMHGLDSHSIFEHNSLLPNNLGFENSFDIVFAAPPFGMKMYDHFLNNNFKINTNDYSGLFLEHCLNLLKSGGRMAILLPEGILFAEFHQKIRDFVESKAKIINITSIPSDAFAMTASSVKRSILFLKKFTEKETAQYESIVSKVDKEMNEKYASEIEGINKKHEDAIQILRGSKTDKSALKTNQKALKEDIQRINQRKADEKRSLIKSRFDYTVPVVNIEELNTNNGQAKSNATLNAIAETFKQYRIAEQLWEKKHSNYSYHIANEALTRISGVSEPDIVYGKQ